MAPGARRTACWPGRGSGLSGPAKWARCWNAWSGAWRDAFAGADSRDERTCRGAITEAIGKGLAAREDAARLANRSCFTYALVSSGLAAHGSQFINIDDGWEGKRDANGILQPNKKFPDMKA